MLCPNCRKETIIVEKDQIELDYCMFCEGFWFDYNEWNILSKKLISENLIENSSDIYNLPVALTGEKPKKCPICCKKMEKFMLYDIILDRCPDRHGVWFDKNEFSACINAMHSKTNTDKQIEFLGEIFKI